MKKGYVQLSALCLGLLVLVVCFGPTAVTSELSDPNIPRRESGHVELSKRLEELIRQLRELRSDYYRQKAQDDAQLQQARANGETLQAQLEDVRQQEADLDQQLQKYESEVQDLRKQLGLRSALRTVVRQQIQPFVATQRAAIESVAPYKQQERIARLEAACKDCNDASGASVADQLGYVWSYAQEEVRLARTSETYTALAPTEDGASPHARYFRVGQLILGYVTEDGRQVGIWWALSDKKGWSLILDPTQAAQVRDAVEILDRRQGPKFVRLPVVIRSESSAQGDR